MISLLKAATFTFQPQHVLHEARKFSSDEEIGFTAL